jgi:transcriptional regulator with XRE-family HTH domain
MENTDASGQPSRSTCGNTRHEIGAELGAKLKAARCRRGWSLRVAGQRVGIAHGYLALLESGVRAPRLAVADRLIEELRLSDDVADRLLAATAPESRWWLRLWAD